MGRLVYSLYRCVDPTEPGLFVDFPGYARCIRPVGTAAPVTGKRTGPHPQERTVPENASRQRLAAQTAADHVPQLPLPARREKALPGPETPGAGAVCGIRQGLRPGPRC